MEQESQPVANSSSVPQNPEIIQPNPAAPALTSQLQVPQIEEFKPAGFFLRYLAYFADMLGLSLGLILVFVVISLGSESIFSVSSHFFVKVLLNNVLPILFTVLYFVIYTYKFGRTPGKTLLGLKVVEYKSGQKPNLKEVLIREVSKQLILIVINLITTILFAVGAYFLIIKNLYNMASLAGGSNFIDSSIKLILLFLLIVIVYFIVLYLIYYKVFFTWREGKRGIQDILAGTQVVVVKPVGKLKKALVIVIPAFIVLGILGILMAIVLIAVNPAKRQSQATDARIKNDIGKISTALIQYWIAKNTFPETLDSLVTNGELGMLPVRSDRIEYSYIKYPPGCLGIAGNECDSVAVYSPLLSPTISGNVWCWRSNSSEAPEEVSVSECTPNN